MKTYLPKIDIQKRAWHIIDADGLILGRLATKVADVLRGKNKPVFTPHLDAGDFVIVINAEKIKLTGNKDAQKTYTTYSGWRGGKRCRTVKDMRAAHPDRIITHAVKGMIPKNRLGKRLLTKLKVYAGPKHPHTAQNPLPLTLDV